MPANFTYRFLKGASWGIVIKLRGEFLPGAVLPSHALKITEAVWLEVDVGWQPSDEELKFLQLGLHLVSHDLERTYRGRTPILVRVTGLKFNPTDYQPEGLAAAVAAWTAQECGFPKPEISVAFDPACRRYVFQFPHAETNPAGPPDRGTQIHITAPPDTWVAESALAVLRHFWDDALFQAVGSSERKPLRDLQVVLRGSTFKDFFIIPHPGSSADVEGAAIAGAPNRRLRFLVKESSSTTPGPQRLTLVCDERTEDIERLQRCLENTLWGNDVLTQGMSRVA